MTILPEFYDIGFELAVFKRKSNVVISGCQGDTELVKPLW